MVNDDTGGSYCVEVGLHPFLILVDFRGANAGRIADRKPASGQWGTGHTPVNTVRDDIER